MRTPFVLLAILLACSMLTRSLPAEEMPISDEDRKAIIEEMKRKLQDDSDELTKQLSEKQKTELIERMQAALNKAAEPAESRVVTPDDDKRQPQPDLRITPRAGGPTLQFVRHLGDARFRHAQSITSIQILDGGKRYFTASQDGSNRLWDAKTGEEITRLNYHADSYAWAGLVLPDGKRAVVAGSVGDIQVWSLATPKIERTLKEKGTIYRMALHPDKRRVLVASDDKFAALWDVETGQRKLTLIGFTGSVYGVAIAPDGATLAAVGADGKLITWQAATGEQIAITRAAKKDSTTRTVCFTPDGKHIVSTATDKYVRCWKADSLDKVWETALPSEAEVISISHDGKRIIAPTENNVCYLLNTAEGKIESQFKLPGINTWPAVFLPGDEQILADVDGCLARFDVKTGKQLFPPHSDEHPATFGPAADAAITSNGDIAYTTVDNVVRMYRVKDGTLLRSWQYDRGDIDTLQLSPDESLLLVGFENGVVGFIETKTGNTRHILPGHGAERCVWKWSARSDTVREYNIEMSTRVVDVNTGKASRAQLREGNSWTIAMVYDRSGGKLAISQNNRIDIFDTDNGQSIGTVDSGNENESADALCFLGDKRLLIAYDDNAQHRLEYWTPAAWQPNQQPPSEAEMAQWVKQLGDNDYQTRERATMRLMEAGPRAETALAKAGMNDAEVRQRVRIIREQLLKADLPARQRGVLNYHRDISSIAAHPDGKHFVMVVGESANCDILLGETTDDGPVLRQRIDNPGSAHHARFSHDGRLLITANRNGTSSVYRFK